MLELMWKVLAGVALLACLALFVPAVRRQLFPAPLDWPDRRPIANLTLATAAAGWPGNPRGWLMDSHLDIRDAAGVARFEQRLLLWARSSVAIMRRVGAQGMVTWDIEGEEFPHKTTYVGDPRLVERLAPEMRGVVDRYFETFRTAGFRVGVAVRPQVFQVEGRPQQRDTSEPAAVLIEKIRYARNRWGATLFYVDSNSWGRIPMPAAIMEKVLQAIPGILLVPEHATPFYYGSTAPYADSRRALAATPGVLRWFYPHAFQVVNVADGNAAEREDEFAAMARHGDVLMFRGWFSDPANSVVERIESAGRGATR